jgi:hypothetical protein
LPGTEKTVPAIRASRLDPAHPTAGISALREKNVILDNAVLNLYYGAKSNAFKEGEKWCGA